jgi:hypothetical protein
VRAGCIPEAVKAFPEQVAQRLVAQRLVGRRVERLVQAQKASLQVEVTATVQQLAGVAVAATVQEPE